jgi:putative intracellular protease/amidase
MQVAIPLFDRFTALDAVGPYDVLRQLPDATVTFVGTELGPVRTDSRSLAINVDALFDDIPSPDIVVVPGGPGSRALLEHHDLIDWVRNAHETSQWTTSVCTGSLFLGAAGLLQGLRATTHWLELETLRDFGAEPTLERVVEQGKIITAAGVSSGIDMALRLASHVAGDRVAQMIQLGIEYDPQPPFDAGSPEKAPADIVEAVRERARQRALARAAAQG